ncbi:MAG: hypothetical protein HZA36_01785 [Parcubacteria group bacterium]|nr:hypothetical protein [Parcubacteria group bacterium]
MKTSHHLIPRSRCEELGIINKNDKRNLKKINGKLHTTWHALFVNLTPYEVIQLLYMLYRFRQEDLFIMKNRDEWKILFGDMTLLEACKQIVREWTPPRSFYTPRFTTYEKEFQTFFSGLFKDFK